MCLTCQRLWFNNVENERCCAVPWALGAGAIQVPHNDIKHTYYLAERIRSAPRDTNKSESGSSDLPLYHNS